MVGHCDHDNGRVRRHGTEDLHGHVRWSAVRIGRCADHCTARACYRIELLYVLLTHSGMYSTVKYFSKAFNQIFYSCRVQKN